MSETPNSPELAKPPILPSGARGWGWLVAKIAVSAAILALLSSRVDFASVSVAFATLSPILFLSGLAAIGAANCLAGLRWSVLTQKLSARVSATDGVGMYVAAMFVGQILPSTLGVDAVRCWLASRKYKPLSEVAGGIVADRAFGMIGLALLLLFGAPGLLAIDNMEIRQAAVFAVVTLAAGIFCATSALLIFLRLRLSGRLGFAQERVQIVLHGVLRRQGIAALAISLTLHGLLVASIALIAASVGSEITPGEAFATVPAAMLISAIPISINGWGLREGAMVACLGLIGVPSSKAFVISILFGIGQLIAALPGAAYWILSRKRRSAL